MIRKTAIWIVAGVLAATLGLSPWGNAAFASAGPAGSALEVNYQNPITAAPPLRRPGARSCTVTLMRHDFAFSYGHPFTGTYTPPPACPGPWSMVALDWNGSIAGRQYDRYAGVWVGGVELLRTTTPEPSPQGISWHVEKDVSEYASVFGRPQTVGVDLGNLVNSTYTGVFSITLTLTFYEADAHNPPAAHPDMVVPISQASQTPSWFTLNDATQAASATLTLPTNLTRARLDVYASAHGCEEFWYTNVPDAYAQQNPQAGLCGGGAFREIQVFVDGTPAGVATPFPVIYTGGINPYLWRPIPGIEAFDIAPYRVDLTPFAGLLSDGRPHTIAIKVANNTGYWPVDADLLLNQDSGVSVTGGRLVRDTLRPDASVSVTQTSSGGTDRLVTRATRSWTVEGFVNTSAGVVTTTVRQDMSTVNDQHNTLNGPNALQVVAQTQHTRTTTTVIDSRGQARVTTVVDDYPLAATSDYAEGTQPNGDPGFTLRGAVDLALERRVILNGQRTSRLDDHLTARALLVRDTKTGANLAADGTDSERYVLTSDDGCYDHLLEAAHGYITEDRLDTDCGPVVIPPTATPELASGELFGTGVVAIGLALFHRRRTRRRAQQDDSPTF